MIAINKTPQEFEAAFVEFVAQAQVKVNTYYAKNFPTLKTPKIEFEPGRRYIRLIETGESQRSCFGFIDATNGDVLKSAGWKSPAKNFARGNLFDANGGLGRVGPYGIG